MKKSDFKEIKNRGFYKKWWDDKAAGNCKGIGVEKGAGPLHEVVHHA